jgi:CDP-glycerol glycerophosphotransferase (TagB/SpsB family)
MDTIKKRITFIAQDDGEKVLCKNIVEEAKRRGYFVTITEDIFTEDEIVFYCQHSCFPKRHSKLSCVMLHDLGQQHGLWPNIWIKENWDKFDIGFLPNEEWTQMWQNASKYSFACPKRGCFHVGWPKADILNSKDFHIRAQRLAQKINLKHERRTVLYAPSWEFENKQLEFINAFKDTDVNMLIKQYPIDINMFPQQYNNIKEMEEACRGMKDVYILDSKESIFTAIVLADILVSDESSTLLENMLTGKPSIAVTDWLIPDQEPPRLPVIPYKFVIKTDKAALQRTAFEVLSNYEKYSNQAKQYRNLNFPHIGNTAKMILDVIDAYIDDKIPEIEPIKKTSSVLIPSNIRRKRNYWRRVEKKNYILYRYCLTDNKFSPIKYLYKCYRLLKKAIRKSNG